MIKGTCSSGDLLRMELALSTSSVRIEQTTTRYNLWVDIEDFLHRLDGKDGEKVRFRNEFYIKINRSCSLKTVR